MVKVLFVCTGNICRSPTAEGVVRALATIRGLDGRLEVDSAGTHAYHLGEPPDTRTIAAARRRGISLDSLRARQVESDDFLRFDLILAMDRSHLELLRRRCPPNHHDKVRLFLSFAPATGSLDVPDPYYEDADAFDRVLDLIENGAHGLLDHIAAGGQ